MLITEVYDDLCAEDVLCSHPLRLAGKAAARYGVSMGPLIPAFGAIALCDFCFPECLSYHIFLPCIGVLFRFSCESLAHISPYFNALPECC